MHNLFDAAFHLYSAQVYYFCRRMLDNDEDAKDIVTDAFMLVWMKKENFFNTIDIKAYVMLTARSRCLNIIRHRKVIRRTEKEQIYLQTNELTDALNHMVHSELVNQVYNEIEKLPLRRKEVLKLSLIGLSNTEIANKLGISIHTVKEHKGKYMKYLKLKFKHLM